MKSWERDKMVRDEGIRLGIEQGIEQSVVGMVKTCQELGVKREVVLVKLIENFGLEKEKAEIFIEKYWNI